MLTSIMVAMLLSPALVDDVVQSAPVGVVPSGLTEKAPAMTPPSVRALPGPNDDDDGGAAIATDGEDAPDAQVTPSSVARPGEASIPVPTPIGPRLPTTLTEKDAPALPAPVVSSTTPDGVPLPDEPKTEWPTGWMQLGSEVGTSCVCCGCPGAFSMVAIPASIVVFWIPYVGLISSVVLLALPGILGCAGFVLAPFVAIPLGVIWPEWLGTQRGAMVWPFLSFLVAEAASLVVMSVGVVVLAGYSTVFVFSTLNPAFSALQPTSGEPVFQNWQAWDFNSLGVGSAASFALLLSGVFAAVVAPPLAATLSYELLADEKSADDVDFRFPGVFSPNPLTDEDREGAMLDAERDELKARENKRIEEKKQDEWRQKQRDREDEKQKEKSKDKKQKTPQKDPLPVSFPIRY